MKKLILLGLMAIGAANAQAQWSLTGNAGTNPPTNFIGTTDNKDVVFKRNSATAGLLTATFEITAFGVGAHNTGTGGFSIYGNSAFGYNALRNNTGSANTAVGARALTANTGINNTATGAYALTNNTSGNSNTATGTNALTYNTTGSNNTGIGVSTLFSNTTGYDNTATGYLSLINNTTGFQNESSGSLALYSNTTGYQNTANGTEALYNNTTGVNNTATGYQALYINPTGSYNTAHGNGALRSNTTGYDNTASGVFSLYDNTIGQQNTGNGAGALQNNTTGDYNTATGAYALNDNITGALNTAVGYLSGPYVGGYNNTSALGYNAFPPASNTVQLGNYAITGVYSAGLYYGPSDGRFKKNIQENVPGLEFINQLKPVTYNFKIHELNDFVGIEKNKGQQTSEQRVNEAAITNKEKIVYTGFIAQEVEKAAQKVNYNFSGIHKPESEKDIYGLSYSDFVVPLVKAVQELSAKNEEKQNEIKQLNDKFEEKEKQLNDKVKALEEKLNAFINNHSGTTELNNNTTIVLDQNAPNPFAESTTINYSINTDFSAALIAISNNNGVVIKTYPITTKGKSQLTVYGSNLSAGVYHYSLIVDGKTIETKSMVKN